MIEDVGEEEEILEGVSTRRSSEVFVVVVEEGARSEDTEDREERDICVEEESGLRSLG